MASCWYNVIVFPSAAEPCMEGRWGQTLPPSLEMCAKQVVGLEIWFLFNLFSLVPAASGRHFGVQSRWSSGQAEFSRLDLTGLRIAAPQTQSPCVIVGNKRIFGPVNSTYLWISMSFSCQSREWTFTANRFLGTPQQAKERYIYIHGHTGYTHPDDKISPA